MRDDEVTERGIDVLVVKAIRISGHRGISDENQGQSRAVPVAANARIGSFIRVTHDHRMVEGFDRIFQVSDGRINDEKSNMEEG